MGKWVIVLGLVLASFALQRPSTAQQHLACDILTAGSDLLAVNLSGATPFDWSPVRTSALVSANIIEQEAK